MQCNTLYEREIAEKSGTHKVQITDRELEKKS